MGNLEQEALQRLQQLEARVQQLEQQLEQRLQQVVSDVESRLGGGGQQNQGAGQVDPNQVNQAGQNFAASQQQQPNPGTQNQNQ